MESLGAGPETVGAAKAEDSGAEAESDRNSDESLDLELQDSNHAHGPSHGDSESDSQPHPTKRALDFDGVADGKVWRAWFVSLNLEAQSVKSQKYSLQATASDLVPSRFKASGLPAADISSVQQAALESVGKPVLTPQQQLELLKQDRAKKAKPKGAASSLVREN